MRYLFLALAILWTQTILLSKSVDFQVKNLKINTPSEGAGGQVKIMFQPFNAGDSVVQEFHLAYFLSTDPFLDNLDHKLDELNQIVPTNGAFITKALNIPGQTTPGDYYIIVVLDKQNYVDEINESNNNASIGFKVKQDQIDLVLLSNQIAGELIAGENIPVILRFSNSGVTTCASGNAEVYLSEDATIGIDDTKLQNPFFFGLIEPGSTQLCKGTLNIPLNTPEGKYFLIIKMVPGEVLSDLNYANNILSTAVGIFKPESTLLLTDLTIPKQVAIGSKGEINYKISNTEKQKVLELTASLDLYDQNGMLVDNNMFPHYYTNQLKADSSIVVTQNFSVPESLSAGVYTVKLTLKALGDTKKSVHASVSLEIINRDVKIKMSKPQLSRVIFPSSSLIDISGIVENTGTTDLGTGKILTYLSKDSLFDSEDIPIYPFPYTFDYGFRIDEGIAAKASTNYTYSVFIEAAEGSYFIILNTINGWEGTDLSGNMPVVPVKITASRKKLALELAPLNNNVFYKEDPTPVNYTLHNLGNSDLINSGVIFYLSKDTTFDLGDQFIGRHWVSPETVVFPALSNRVINNNFLQLSSNFIAGFYNLLAMTTSGLSSNDTVIEYMKIEVRDSDMAFALEDFKASYRSAGLDSIDFSFTLKHTGTTPSNRTFINYYLSADTVYSADDVSIYLDDIVPGVAPGQEIKYSAKARLPVISSGAGPVYLLASKDLLILLSSQFNPEVYYTPINADISGTVERFMELEVHLFPNPANEEFSVETYNQNDIQEISVKNMFGEIVLQPTFPYKQIDVQGLPSGIYLIQLQTVNGSTSRKLVKK